MKSPSFAWEIQSAKRAHTQQRLKTQPKVSPAGYPDEDTLGDIERHLVNEHNPTLLHAKRKCQTANVIIVFEGSVSTTMALSIVACYTRNSTRRFTHVADLDTDPMFDPTQRAKDAEAVAVRIR